MAKAILDTINGGFDQIFCEGNKVATTLSRYTDYDGYCWWDDETAFLKDQILDDLYKSYVRTS